MSKSEKKCLLCAERETEINELKAAQQRTDQENKEQVRRLEEQINKDKQQLERMKLRIAELEKELEEKKRKYEKLKDVSAENENKLKNQHKQVIENTREQLLREKTKAHEKEIGIKELEKEILSMTVDKLTMFIQFKDQEKALEKERDKLKGELVQLRQNTLERSI